MQQQQQQQQQVLPQQLLQEPSMLAGMPQRGLNSNMPQALRQAGRLAGCRAAAAGWGQHHSSRSSNIGRPFHVPHCAHEP
jgi:hypothetical protein